MEIRDIADLRTRTMPLSAHTNKVRRSPHLHTSGILTGQRFSKFCNNNQRAITNNQGYKNWYLPFANKSHRILPCRNQFLLDSRIRIFWSRNWQGLPSNATSLQYLCRWIPSLALLSARLLPSFQYDQQRNSWFMTILVAPFFRLSHEIHWATIT